MSYNIKYIINMLRKKQLTIETEFFEDSLQGIPKALLISPIYHSQDFQQQEFIKTGLNEDEDYFKTAAQTIERLLTNKLIENFMNCWETLKGKTLNQQSFIPTALSSVQRISSHHSYFKYPETDNPLKKSHETTSYQGLEVHSSKIQWLQERKNNKKNSKLTASYQQRTCIIKQIVDKLRRGRQDVQKLSFSLDRLDDNYYIQQQISRLEKVAHQIQTQRMNLERDKINRIELAYSLNQLKKNSEQEDQNDIENKLWNEVTELRNQLKELRLQSEQIHERQMKKNSPKSQNKDQSEQMKVEKNTQTQIRKREQTRLNQNYHQILGFQNKSSNQPTHSIITMKEEAQARLFAEKQQIKRQYQVRSELQYLQLHKEIELLKQTQKMYHQLMQQALNKQDEKQQSKPIIQQNQNKLLYSVDIQTDKMQTMKEFITQNMQTSQENTFNKKIKQEIEKSQSDYVTILEPTEKHQELYRKQQQITNDLKQILAAQKQFLLELHAKTEQIEQRKDEQLRYKYQHEVAWLHQKIRAIELDQQQIIVQQLQSKADQQLSNQHYQQIQEERQYQRIAQQQKKAMQAYLEYQTQLRLALSRQLELKQQLLRQQTEKQNILKEQILIQQQNRLKSFSLNQDRQTLTIKMLKEQHQAVITPTQSQLKCKDTIIQQMQTDLSRLQNQLQLTNLQLESTHRTHQTQQRTISKLEIPKHQTPNHTIVSPTKQQTRQINISPPLLIHQINLAQAKKYQLGYHDTHIPKGPLNFPINRELQNHQQSTIQHIHHRQNVQFIQSNPIDPTRQKAANQTCQTIRLQQSKVYPVTLQQTLLTIKQGLTTQRTTYATAPINSSLFKVGGKAEHSLYSKDFTQTKSKIIYWPKQQQNSENCACCF